MNIKYIYAASGQKLRKATHRNYKSTNNTDYVGSFIYQDGQLQTILTPEGRVVVYGSSYEYQYFLKDHLGNTRINFNENKKIIQEDSYYPYGMNMSGLSHSSGEDLPNKYLYNGKELQDDFGLGWYDYGARFYDPTGVHWTTPDLMAESYYAWSPYNYALNNPISFIDPNGMYVDNYDIYSNGNIVKYETNDKSNTYAYIKEDGTKHVVGTYNKNDKGLVQLGNIDDSGGSGANISVKSENSDRMYASGDAVASLIGASASSGQEISVISISKSDGSSPSPSVSHKDGKNMDTRYAGKNGSRDAINYKDNKANFDKIDQTASGSMNTGLKKFGWKDIRSSTLTISNTASVGGKEVTTSTNYSISGTTHLKDHYNHQHIQGYRPNVVTRIQAPNPIPMRPFKGF